MMLSRSTKVVCTVDLTRNRGMKSNADTFDEKTMKQLRLLIKRLSCICVRFSGYMSFKNIMHVHHTK